MSDDEVTIPSSYTLIDEKPKPNTEEDDPFCVCWCLISLWEVLKLIGMFLWKGLKLTGECLRYLCYCCVFWGDCDSHPPPIPVPLSPLINKGNTCYFNVIIQALNQTKELRHMFDLPQTFKLTSKSGEERKIMVDKLGTISKELYILLFAMKQSECNTSINPGDLLSKINESGQNTMFDRNQQDAHELLRCLLQLLKNEQVKCIRNEVQNYKPPLSEELKSEYIRAANKDVSLIDQNIGGVCINTIICRECFKPVQLQEPFYDLSLSIPDQEVNVNRKNRGPVMKTRHAANVLTHTSINSDGTGDSSSQVVVSASGLRPPPILEAQEHHVDSALATDFTSLQQYLCDEGFQYHPLSSKRFRLQGASGLEQSLYNYTDVDVLDDDNRFICNICNKNDCLVSKQALITRLKNVLIFHVKRFNIGVRAVTKNNKFLSFSPMLDMAPYCSNDCLQNLQDKNGQILYGLYAVVVHISRTLRSGHYIAYVRVRPDRSDGPPLSQGSEYDQSAAHDGVWYYTSDQTINRCSGGFEDVKVQQAYLLFYEKLPTK